MAAVAARTDGVQTAKYIGNTGEDFTKVKEASEELFKQTQWYKDAIEQHAIWRQNGLPKIPERKKLYNTEGTGPFFEKKRLIQQIIYPAKLDELGGGEELEARVEQIFQRIVYLPFQPWNSDLWQQWDRLGIKPLPEEVLTDKILRRALLPPGWSVDGSRTYKCLMDPSNTRRATIWLDFDKTGKCEKGAFSFSDNPSYILAVRERQVD